MVCSLLLLHIVRAVLHEPPRRVLAPLPYSPISVSDYLFPGEGPADSLASLADLLDLGTLLEGDVQVYFIDFFLPSFLSVYRSLQIVRLTLLRVREVFSLLIFSLSLLPLPNKKTYIGLLGSGC